MSAASEISHNVWLGPTPDPAVTVPPANEPSFDVMVEASDIAQIPENKAFELLEELLERKDNAELAENAIPQLEFPGSGAILPPTWSQAEVDGLLATCEWMYKQAHTQPLLNKRRDSKLSVGSDVDEHGDSIMQSEEAVSEGRRILIHCTDGYTESSLLGLAYYMYAECVPVHDAWLQLHREKRRNFFAYGSDVALLRAVQPRILQSSPKYSGNLKSLCPPVPAWLEKMDGSLPSRILDYIYLGNLGHANNPELLNELGIGQILSVGEPVLWPKDARDAWPKENLLFVDKVQDNGVDPLTEEFPRCLEFIGKSVLMPLLRIAADSDSRERPQELHQDAGTLPSRRLSISDHLHCRGDERAGLIVPSRILLRPRQTAECHHPAPSSILVSIYLPSVAMILRLNVSSYELLKWEEFQCQKRSKPLRRELEWASIAREIAAMNKPYSRQG